MLLLWLSACWLKMTSGWSDLLQGKDEMDGAVNQIARERVDVSRGGFESYLQAGNVSCLNFDIRMISHDETMYPILEAACQPSLRSFCMMIVASTVYKKDRSRIITDQPCHPLHNTSRGPSNHKTENAVYSGAAEITEQSSKRYRNCGSQPKTQRNWAVNWFSLSLRPTWPL